VIIKMSEDASEEQIEHVIGGVLSAGYQPHAIRGAERTIVAAVGSGGDCAQREVLPLSPGVDNVIAIAHPFKLVSRQLKPQFTIVNGHGVLIGGLEVVAIAGRCSVDLTSIFQSESNIKLGPVFGVKRLGIGANLSFRRCL
jgi:3-deoxy-7-phosphoheptulonate synthase